MLAQLDFAGLFAVEQAQLPGQRQVQVLELVLVQPEFVGLLALERQVLALAER